MLLSLASLQPSRAQVPLRSRRKSIIRANGTYLPREGVFTIVLPRTDALVVQDYQRMPTTLGLNTWAAFSPATHHGALLATSKNLSVLQAPNEPSLGPRAELLFRVLKAPRILWPFSGRKENMEQQYTAKVSQALLAKVGRLFTHRLDHIFVELLENARRAAATRVEVNIQPLGEGVNTVMGGAFTAFNPAGQWMELHGNIERKGNPTVIRAPNMAIADEAGETATGSAFLPSTENARFWRIRLSVMPLRKRRSWNSGYSAVRMAPELTSRGPWSRDVLTRWGSQFPAGLFWPIRTLDVANC